MDDTNSIKLISRLLQILPKVKITMLTIYDEEIYRQYAEAAGAFVAIPMLIASWILGLWGGLLAGLLAIPFVTLLYYLVGNTGWGSWLGFLVTLLISEVAGHMCDLSKRLRKEVGEHKLSEEALWERSRRMMFRLWSEQYPVTDT